jgi:hypothetical protein
MVTFEQQILNEADSLFREGNYEYAKVKYAKAREIKPKSDVAKYPSTTLLLSMFIMTILLQTGKLH